MENRIKELRQTKGLSQSELAQKVGISNQAISHYETGKRHAKIETWQKLADYFNVSVPYLQGFEMQTPNRLKELRIKRKLTLDDIEEKTGIKRGTYSNYENGKTEPKLEAWQKLADYYGVSVPYIQGGLDTEYLEKLVETLMLINLPGLVLKYRNNELDNLYKPFITIAFTGRIINLLGYDSREKFEEIYTKAIKLGDSHLNSNELKEYKRYLIKILTTSKEIANNLLKEYEKLEEKQK